MSRPKERDEQEALKLDEYFKETVERIRPYILSLGNAERSQLCRLWLDKLSCACSQRSLRNQYLLELCRHLKSGQVSDGIFSKPPRNGALMPLPKSCHHSTSKNVLIRETSSLSELSDTSRAAYVFECLGPSNMKRRSKTLNCHHRCKSDLSSSTNCDDNVFESSPRDVEFCDNSRIDKNHLITCQQPAENLTTIANQMRIQNDLLTQNIFCAQGQCDCKQNTNNLRFTIDRLTDEIITLKTKLVEVRDMKTLLAKNHRDIVQQYKSAMTEQFNELNARLREVQSKNMELDENVATVNQRVEEITRQKEEELSRMEQKYKNEIDSSQNNFKRLLMNKNEDSQSRTEIINQKNAELSDLAEKNKKNAEKIVLACNKIQELEKKLETKIQDEDKLQSILKALCSTIKNEFFKMQTKMESATQMPNETLNNKISALKHTILKLEKSKQKLSNKYEKKVYSLRESSHLEIERLVLQFQEERNQLSTTLNTEKDSEINNRVTSLEERYKCFLTEIDNNAGCQRKHLMTKITILENEITCLKNKIVDRDKNLIRRFIVKPVTTEADQKSRRAQTHESADRFTTATKLDWIIRH